MQVRTFSLHFLSNFALLVPFLFNNASERKLPGMDRFWGHIFHSTWPSVAAVLPHLRPQESVPATQVRTCSPHFPLNLSRSLSDHLSSIQTLCAVISSGAGGPSGFAVRIRPHRSLWPVSWGVSKTIFRHMTIMS